MSSQENPPAQPARRPRGRPRLATPSQYSPGLPRDHPMESLPPTARSILEAARRVLAQRGLEGLTIEAVANEANVSRTLIPYHFGSRAGLVAILFDSLFHDLAVSVYGLAGPGGSLPTFLDWIKREADDVQSQHDFFELIVSALREPELAAPHRRPLRRLPRARPRDDRRERAARRRRARPGTALSDTQRRELAAIGSVLVAIEDGLGLQAALDPAFDVDGALAMVETMLGDALARLKAGYEPEAPATR